MGPTYNQGRKIVKVITGLIEIKTVQNRDETFLLVIY